MKEEHNDISGKEARLLGFRHVEVIHAVMLTGSITGAATRLHVTQPAISNTVREAEERLGFALFNRQSGRIVPTYRAGQLFQEIQRSFIGLSSINDFCASLRKSTAPLVRIATIPSWAASVLPAVLRAYREQHPGVRFSIQPGNSHHVQSLVSANKVDIGFGLSVPAIPHVRSDRVADSEMLCMLPAGHPLCQREGIRALDLVAEPMITYSRIEGVDEAIAAAFRAHGGLPASVVESPAELTARSMVAAGLGCALVFPFSATPSREIAVMRPFVPRVSVQLQAYYVQDLQADFDLGLILQLAREHTQEAIASATSRG